MAQLAVPVVITAATQLMRAAQWTAATDLLRAATTDDPADQRALALALAEVAVDHDFTQPTDHAAPELASVARLLETLPDATTSWDLAMLHLRKEYADELFTEDRTQTTAAALAQRAEQLRDQAPDDSRRGLASFYAGVIADNLRDDRDAAFTHFTDALELGKQSADDLLAALALRHLGDCAHTTGNLKLAREQWERSIELLQKVGHLRASLAQQALLASLLRDEGDPAGARALATEVHRWSTQLGLAFITRQTAEMIN
jgi:tetratricopeptide (TPR) repeat protein